MMDMITPKRQEQRARSPQQRLAPSSSQPAPVSPAYHPTGPPNALLLSSISVTTNHVAHHRGCCIQQQGSSRLEWRRHGRLHLLLPLLVRRDHDLLRPPASVQKQCRPGLGQRPAGARHRWLLRHIRVRSHGLQRSLLDPWGHASRMADRVDSPPGRSFLELSQIRYSRHVGVSQSPGGIGARNSRRRTDRRWHYNNSCRKPAWVLGMMMKEVEDRSSLPYC
jgi:hypothetical protein